MEKFGSGFKAWADNFNSLKKYLSCDSNKSSYCLYLQTTTPCPEVEMKNRKRSLEKTNTFYNTAATQAPIPVACGNLLLYAIF